MLRKAGIIGLLLLSACAPPQPQERALKAHVEVKQEGKRFTYLLVNEEPAESPQHITVWGMYPNAPFTVISTPEGWACETNRKTYLDCANTDSMQPYPHDIAPGKTGRFVIESEVESANDGSAVIIAWDHEKDTGGAAFEGQIKVPVDPALVDGQ